MIFHTDQARAGHTGLRGSDGPANHVPGLCACLTYKLVRSLKSFSLSSVIRLFCRSRNFVSRGIFFGTSVRPEDETKENREGSHTPLNASVSDCEPTP